jgi:uncharacterized protein YegL
MVRNGPPSVVPCVMALDVSGSMSSNDNIGKLNIGLRAFHEQISACDVKDYLDVAIVTFGPVKVFQDFTPFRQWYPPELRIDGGTPLFEALDKSMLLLNEQKGNYKRYQLSCGRPWIFCITDGAPTDSDISNVAARLQTAETNGELTAICIGTPGFALNAMLNIFTPEHVFALENMNYAALFGFFRDMIIADNSSDNADYIDPTKTVTPPSDVKAVGFTRGR